MTASLAACGADAPAAGDPSDVPMAERYGGTAVVGLPADLQTLNAFTATDYVSGQVIRHILLMSLVQIDPDGRPLPWLASRWDTTHVAGDSIQVTFHLRNDVQWHDGSPTTAQDVRFTFERALDPEMAYPGVHQFKFWSRRAEVLDSFTIRFRFRKNAAFLGPWEALPIMPAHQLADVPPTDMVRHPFGVSQFLGNGPFRFARRDPGQQWVFDANPLFPAELGGRPFLDRLVFRVIPEQTTLMTELVTGSVDAYEPTTSQVASLRAASGVSVLSGPRLSFTMLELNTLDPALSDARVRRALSLAIDRRELVDGLLSGEADAGISTSSPAHWVYDADYERLAPRVDRSEASRLLAEAGWRPGPDGILRNGRGAELRFSLMVVSTDQETRQVAEVVQAQLKQVGVAVVVRALEQNALWAILDGVPAPGGGRQRDFQADITMFNELITKKIDEALFHSRSRNNPLAATGFSSSRTDALIDTLDLIPERAAARALWQEYHSILLTEAPLIVLYYPRVLVGHDSALNSVTLSPRGYVESIRQWWLLPTAR
jgi:peptide/nickel transport system substrate-binding protein